MYRCTTVINIEVTFSSFRRMLYRAKKKRAGRDFIRTHEVNIPAACAAPKIPAAPGHQILIEAFLVSFVSLAQLP